jgi:hypothetical protein
MNSEMNRLTDLLTGSTSSSLSARLLGANDTAARALSESGKGSAFAAFIQRDGELRRLASGLHLDGSDVFSAPDFSSLLNRVYGGPDFARAMENILGTSTSRFDFAREAEDRMCIWRKQLGDIDAIASRQFAGINLNTVGEILRVSGGFHEYSKLIESVHSIALPPLDFDFTERLGKAFRADDFFNLKRADDVQRYLLRTQLPEEFIEAKPELISASLVDLGLVSPLRPQQTRNTTPRRLKANQSKRNSIGLRELIEWFERALRDKVHLVMQERAGADWVRTLDTSVTKKWAKSFDAKQSQVWTMGYAPQREIESALFSEFLTFAFLSDDCAPLLLIEPSIPRSELGIEISRLNDARNAVFHGFERASPHHLTITMGIVYKLAGVAGLIVPLTYADLEESTTD